MYKIAVIGDKASVLGFKALGLDVFPVDTPDEARQTLHRLAGEEYAIVYLTETFGAAMAADLAYYKDALRPAVILIPGREGSLGIGKDNLQKAIERAVGADIL